MGLFSSIVEFFIPEKPAETRKVEATSTTAVKKDNSVFESKGNKTENKNTDNYSHNIVTRESIYKKIEDICIKYNVKMEDVMTVGLLEQIAGCTTEELLKKSEEEIEKYIQALKDSMSWTQTFFGKSLDDIEKIAKKANKKYIENMTGGRSFLKETWKGIKGFFTGDRGDLENRLKNAGYEISAEGVRKYFDDILKEAIESKDPQKIQEAYDEALEVYGDLLNATEDPKQREILTAAISRLQADKRALGVELSLASCGNDTESKQSVARGVAENYEEITCNEDAFGNYTSSDDNIYISTRYSSNMNYQDFEAHQNYMKSRREYLQNKKNNGEMLTAAEERYLNTVQIDEYAGNIIGMQQNQYTTSEEKNKIINEIHNTVEEFGIGENVYKTARKYIEQHSQSGITTKQFDEMMDKATEGKYSKNNSQNHKQTQTKTETQTKYNSQKESNANTTTKPNEQNVEENSACQITENTVDKKTKKYSNNCINSNKAESPSKSEYVSNPVSNSNTNVTDKKTANTNKSNNTKQYKNFAEASKYGNAGIAAYAANNKRDVITLLKEFVSDFKDITNSDVIITMVKIYKENPEKQEMILKNASGSAMSLLLKHTDNNVLKNFKGKGSSFWDTKQIEQAKEELIKDA